MKKKLLSFALGAAASIAAVTAAQAGTLDDVRQKGFVQCGVSQGLIGFSFPDEQNNWNGMDVDFCRAVAAVVFNDPTKVKFTPLSAKERFTALQSGEIDILSRNTTWTMSRDTSLGLKFAGVMYYDGQGFLINAKKYPDVTSAAQLSGASVCTQTGTTTELNLADYFKSNNMEYKLVAFEKNEEALAAYKDGRCDVYTTDQSGIYAERLKLPNPEENVVLPEIISKEPPGPVARPGHHAGSNAVTRPYTPPSPPNNIEEMKTSKNPEVQRLLGVANADGSAAGFGTGLGLEESWAENAIKAVGNYGEIFDRNVGPNTPLKIARGKNALWKDGGLQYAPPIR